ncbi:MAG: magnesium transporter [Ruminococcus sp.]|nr:magnesium transporter [Ruminococcus sp.]
MIKVLRRGGLFATVVSENFKKVSAPSVQNKENNQKDLCEPISKGVSKRLPWLIILLFMGTGVSAVVGVFESIVVQLPVIMCFQSLILDMAGNVGTQSLAVAIRVLMDEKVDARSKLVLVLKECYIGIINGAILGILSFITIGAYLCIKGNSASFSFSVSGCLGIAMVVAMAISSFAGTIIPVAFQKFGVDPAVASGPLITTINDMVAVVTYYGLSWLLLLHIMHLG